MSMTDTLECVCSALTDGSPSLAAEIVDRECPFSPVKASQRTYGPLDLTTLFVRDGFIDRYSNERLVFPPALRLISAEIPEAFPYHLHWKTDATHSAFWEMGATLDHVVPVALGGVDDESNWVTTSMARNSAKMSFTLDQLGWKLHPRGSFEAWDGLLRWFVDYGRRRPTLLEGNPLNGWHRAAESILRTLVVG